MTRTGSFDFLDPVPSLTDILQERSDALTEQVLGDKAFLGGMGKVFSALAKPRPEEPEHERPCPLAYDYTPDGHEVASVDNLKCTCNLSNWTINLDDIEAVY